MNTSEFLEEILGEARGRIWSYSNKNCHVIFCFTISNQNYDKTHLLILGVLTCMLQSTFTTKWATLPIGAVPKAQTVSLHMQVQQQNLDLQFTHQ